MAGEYYLPLYFQSALSASPSRSGLLILPITATEAVVGIFVGIFIHRTGRYLELLYAGGILMVVGNGLYILLSSTTPLSQIIGFQIIAGVGQGLLFEAPLIAIQAGVSQANTATATSTLMFIRNLATALTVVICGVIFQNSMDVRASALGSPPLNVPANITDLLTGGRAGAHVMIVQQIGDPVQRQAVKDAFVWSMRNMWIFATGIAVLATAATVFVRKEVLSNVHTETITGLKEKTEILPAGEARVV